MKNLKLSAIALSLLVALLSGCADDDYFWYPVTLSYAKCTNFSGEVYTMTNSRGWRTWPYILDKKTKLELTLPNDCVISKVRLLPIHKNKIRDSLTDEQRYYLVEGF